MVFRTSGGRDKNLNCSIDGLMVMLALCQFFLNLVTTTWAARQQPIPARNVGSSFRGDLHVGWHAIKKLTSLVASAMPLDATSHISSLESFGDLILLLIIATRQHDIW